MVYGGSEVGGEIGFQGYLQCFYFYFPIYKITKKCRNRQTRLRHFLYLFNPFPLIICISELSTISGTQFNDLAIFDIVPINVKTYEGTLFLPSLKPGRSGIDMQ